MSITGTCQIPFVFLFIVPGRINGSQIRISADSPDSDTLCADWSPPVPANGPISLYRVKVTWHVDDKGHVVNYTLPGNTTSLTLPFDCKVAYPKEVTLVIVTVNLLDGRELVSEPSIPVSYTGVCSVSKARKHLIQFVRIHLRDLIQCVKNVNLSVCVSFNVPVQ